MSKILLREGNEYKIKRNAPKERIREMLRDVEKGIKTTKSDLFCIFCYEIIILCEKRLNNKLEG